MKQSRLKPCSICHKEVRARGYYGHLLWAHGITKKEEFPRRPKCQHCLTEGALISWSEHPPKFIFRCPRCYSYLGPASFHAAMSLPLIPGDQEDLEELRETEAKTLEPVKKQAASPTTSGCLAA